MHKAVAIKMKTKCILALLLAVFYFAAFAFEPLDLSVVVPFEIENSKNITANLSDLDKSPSSFVGARLDLPKGGEHWWVSVSRSQN